VLARTPPATWERIHQVFVFDDHSADATVKAALEQRPRGGGTRSGSSTTG
jgi:hypothetical protein